MTNGARLIFLSRQSLSGNDFEIDYFQIPVPRFREGASRAEVNAYFIAGGECSRNDDLPSKAAATRRHRFQYVLHLPERP